MDANSLPSEKAIVLGRVNPQTVTTVQYSDVIDMSKFLQAMGIALLGAINAGDTIVFSAYECDGSGNNASVIVTPGGTTKQVTLSATSGNQNTQIQMGIRAEDLTGQTYQHLKFGLSCGTTGGPAAVVALGLEAKYGPASDWALSSVTEK
jgi:hypothetical protein